MGITTEEKEANRTQKCVCVFLQSSLVVVVVSFFNCCNYNFAKGTTKYSMWNTFCMYNDHQQWQQDNGASLHRSRDLNSMKNFNGGFSPAFWLVSQVSWMFFSPCPSVKVPLTSPERLLACFAAHWWHNYASPMLMLKAKSLSFIFPPSAPFQPPHCILPDRMARSKWPQASDTNRVKASHLKSVTP